MSLKKKYKIIISLLLIISSTCYVGFTFLMKAPEKIETKAVFFSSSAKDLLFNVQKNDTVWSSKIVQLKGVITAIGSKGITLENQIYCQLKEEQDVANFKLNTLVSLKGRIIGYDDVLEDLKLDQCIKIIPTL